MTERVIVFLDYQNVFGTARQCFHTPTYSASDGQIDPLKSVGRHRGDPGRPARSLTGTSSRSFVGIEDWSRHVVQDPRCMRPAEVDTLIGDASKARDVLGLQPKMTFEELIATMVEADLAEERPLDRT